MSTLSPIPFLLGSFHEPSAEKVQGHSNCLILLNTQFVHKIFQIFVPQCSKDYYVNQMTKHRVLIYLYFLRTNASKSIMEFRQF